MWIWGKQTYHLATVLEALRGCWVFAPADTAALVNGVPPPRDANGNVSAPLREGWNLFGPVGDIPVVYPLPPPVQGSLWGWDDGVHTTADTMRVFRGYWILSESSGAAFILSP